MGKIRPDFTVEASALFSAFAQKHQLAYRADDAPVELLWTFPAQERLSSPVHLGLQNGDELDFGVDDFWSYFFPFPKVHEKFALLLDAWIDGRARIVFGGRVTGHRLQLLADQEWETVYIARGAAKSASGTIVRNYRAVPST